MRVTYLRTRRPAAAPDWDRSSCTRQTGTWRRAGPPRRAAWYRCIACRRARTLCMQASSRHTCDAAGGTQCNRTATAASAPRAAWPADKGVGRRRTRIDSEAARPTRQAGHQRRLLGWLVGGLRRHEGRVCVRVRAQTSSLASWLSWPSGGGAACSSQSASAGGCKFPCRLSAGGY